MSPVPTLFWRTAVATAELPDARCATANCVEPAAVELATGDTAVIVSYRGHVLPVRILVPTVPAKGFVYPRVPEGNYIDREVFAKLRRLNMVPSDLCTDTEFLRRVSLDVTGTKVTAEGVARLRSYWKGKRPLVIATGKTRLPILSYGSLP